MGGIVSKALHTNEDEEDKDGRKLNDENLPLTDRDITVSYDRTNNPSNDRYRSMSYLELDSSKCLIHSPKVLFGSNKNANINSLSGLYAFCLVKSIDEKQYLIMKTLKEHESDHTIFNIFIKRLPGYSDTMKIIAGGEITFSNNELVCWNLKSFGYSSSRISKLINDFDESNDSFHENKAKIWLPSAKFQKMIDSEGYAKNFTKSGSFKAVIKEINDDNTEKKETSTQIENVVLK